MTERHDLRAKLETDGRFWSPENPGSTFSAHLSATPERIELSRSAEFAGVERFFESEDLSIPVLHGHTMLGFCTLIGLHELGSSKVLHGPTGQVITAPRFRVSACVQGVHLTGEASEEIRSGTFSYEGVGDWLRTSTQILMSDSAVVITHPIPSPPVLDFSVTALKAKVELHSRSRLTWSPSGRHSASRDEPQISIEPQSLVSLAWLFDAANRFENFLSLCLGSSTRLHAIRLKTQANDEGWVVRPRQGKLQKPDPQCAVRCTADQLAQALNAWLNMPNEFRSLENLIYGTLRNSSLYVETEFLALAQGIEALHRLTDRERLADQQTFKRVLKSVLGTIRTACPNSNLSTRLVESIRHANEPAFRNRIEWLIRRIDPNNAKSLLGDPTLFEMNLRRTRNFLTHPGIRRSNGVLAGAGELFSLNQKLHAFLRLHMLLHVGFPESVAFEPVLYQSRKWRIL
jgi:hypothetical protein